MDFWGKGMNWSGFITSLKMKSLQNSAAWHMSILGEIFAYYLFSDTAF